MNSGIFSHKVGSPIATYRTILSVSVSLPRTTTTTSGDPKRTAWHAFSPYKNHQSRFEFSHIPKPIRNAWRFQAGRSASTKLPRYTRENGRETSYTPFQSVSDILASSRWAKSRAANSQIYGGFLRVQRRCSSSYIKNITVTRIGQMCNESNTTIARSKRGLP